MPQRYCEIALPVPLRTSFTYAAPPTANGEPLVGRRVVVPFRKRTMIGVALEETERAPESRDRARIKQITEVMDARPALTPNLIELGRWISRYYLAPIGETFRAMLPPEVELRHDREYSLTDLGRTQLAQFALIEDPAVISQTGSVGLLRRFESGETLTSARASRWPGGEAAVEKLVQQGFVTARDVTHHRKARAQTIVAWKKEDPGTPGVGTTQSAEESPRAKSNAAAQIEAGLKPRSSTAKVSQRTEREREAEDRVREFLGANGPMPVQVLIEKANVSRGTIERLKNNDRLLTWEEPITPDEDPWEANFTAPSNVLNAEQNQALAEIWRWIVAGKFTAGLLHGVTGSGKTEVYLGAIEAALSRGKTAIVLVPEIALTLWVGRLVRARFGANVAILHSGLPDVERAREWWRVRNGEAHVVVGTRSAVFAPLENVGLIIVDEEQESAYKQEETPRYHGRDVAVYRARLEGAVALLGSATPSLETYHNARGGKYRLI
ncbi:MAG TPA: DEAD/DEAH box helicase, partial [Candidatus Acidoferrales bacterium]|nr:DEAD/DEAH box helicase [Candidatus Acidoferrales bacterium]